MLRRGSQIVYKKNQEKTPHFSPKTISNTVKFLVRREYGVFVEIKFLFFKWFEGDFQKSPSQESLVSTETDLIEVTVW